MNNPFFVKRDEQDAGSTLYFYSVRTMMLFNYEVLYNISEGLWNSSRYPQDHAKLWESANLYLTQGKVNARNIVNIGVNVPKSDYNLKRLMNIHTSYDRMKTIGKLCMVIDDRSLLIRMLDLGIHEDFSFSIYDYNSLEDLSDSYSEFMSDLRSSSARELYEEFTYDLYCSLVTANYTDDMLKDDLGMIQNTMRNIMTLDNE